MFTFDKSTNQIHQDNEIIGAFDDESGAICLIVELSPPLKGQVKKALTEAGCEVTGYKQVQTLKMNPVTQVVQPGETNPPPPDDNLPAPGSAPMGGNALPPCPAEDHRWGDKTPEVVAWYREHKPEEFAKKYAGRKIG